MVHIKEKNILRKYSWPLKYIDLDFTGLLYTDIFL